MASSAIIIQQGDSNTNPGSRQDLILASAVTLLNANNSGVSAFSWTMIDKPEGSSATLSSASTSTVTFTPDIEGTYLVSLMINGNPALTNSVGAAVVTANLNYRIPAATETVQFNTMGGPSPSVSTRGWAAAVCGALTVLDTAVGGGGAVIGNPVGGGHVNDLLFVDGSGNLSQDDSLTFDGSALSAPSAIFSGSISIDGYPVDLSGSGANEFLSFDGYTWVPTRPSATPPITIGDTIRFGTSKSLLFVDAYGDLAQDNTNLNFDATTHKLTVGGHISADGYTIDVSAGAVSGQALTYNGTSFVATTPVKLSVANTWTQKQTFSAHAAVDGYTIDLSGGMTSGQILEYNGTSIVAAANSSPTSPGSIGFWDNVNWAKATASPGALGDDTTGMYFSLDANATITGARWYQPVGFTNDVTVKLWTLDGGGTLHASVTVTPVAGAINTATFASPFSFVLGTNYGSGYYTLPLWITVYDGVHQILAERGIPTGNDPMNGRLVLGPHIIFMGFGVQAGNTMPASFGTLGYMGIEPMFTVP